MRQDIAHFEMYGHCDVETFRAGWLYIQIQYRRRGSSRIERKSTEGYGARTIEMKH